MRFISQKLKANIFIKVLGIRKIPLLLFCRPKVIEINDQKVIIKIPLKRRTRNHVNSMYIGALVVGADISSGYLAFHHLGKTNKKISLIFKDFHADFLRRAEGDVHFVCNDGDKIKLLIDEVIATQKRCNMTVNVNAFVPGKFNNESVAIFKLTLSIK